jgi:uncharacterized membrane protein
MDSLENRKANLKVSLDESNFPSFWKLFLNSILVVSFSLPGIIRGFGISFLLFILVAFVQLIRINWFCLNENFKQ